ncbi:glutathione S-transferase family protein [Solimonas sp. K1W22B-7]|uniref:glutathione S-transferase family protein n=1 Tax=Solimonas sp. K1W22B-7 TaxID=2303331 RepID=UPI0013C44520|nr:glutathione S-transferase family protein [Solimonas sp. K1W22B-7]
MDLPLLWHIPFSHFNEKARWALDFKNIPHRRRVLGGNYLFRAWRATGRGTLPILFLEGKAVGDSTAIIAALEQYRPEPSLYPKDPAQLQRALALEDYFDEVLGPSLRASVVTPLFHEDPELALRVLTTGMPAQAYDNLRPLARIFPAFYRFRHRIQARRLDQDRAAVAESLARISRELQPGGYLVGDAFSVADLTAAALLAPLLQPAELQYPLAVELPASLRQYRDEVLRHPAAQWALEIYRRHRGISAEVRRAKKAG